MSLGASALYGFVLPLMELTCRKSKQVITYTRVMEMQLVISFFATAFCTIGMLINHDFMVFSSFSLSLYTTIHAYQEESTFMGFIEAFFTVFNLTANINLCRRLQERQENMNLDNQNIM